MLTEYVTHPFFWAFIIACGWAFVPMVLGSKTLGKNMLMGWFVLLLASGGRFVMAMPFIEQPRLGGGVWTVLLGIVIFIIGAVVGLVPTFQIKPLTATNKKAKLNISGFYSYMRHPLMFSDIFWPIGWALMFRSTLLLILSIIGAIYIYFITVFEEEKLVAEYGDEYREFQKKVPRIIPFTKFV